MPKLKSGTIIPTPDEDLAIDRGIAADPDTYELSEADFKQMKRAGRPRAERPKIQLTVRYDQDVVDAFRAEGPGWQSRMNDALREWLKEHKQAA
ncbi:BrnA antitoxin family protein [Achromobacter aloeverae]|uniref:BrnA antitoxin family protein n=1 Tax=Achromobacter aloeverae TaxID=1750518 RepID=A0A4Q1HHS3_9BURK|nr:BrnA antitoxin family protein [Achromobacter aloeverae]RXN87762.1 hypothetical protein C7R54_14275 [Achromobacter aloeverae]